MLKLIIGNRAYSSWSMRGWLACRQSGEQFEEYVVPLFDAEWERRRSGDEFAPSMGKVPILWDGDCVVWDSLAIIEFLADRVGREKFWPADDSARGMARSMAAEMHSSFPNLRRELPMNVRRTYPPVELSEPVREEIDRILQLWAQARAVRRNGQLSVRRLVRRRHHVRSRRHPLHHLRGEDAVIRRGLHGRGPVASGRRRLGRPGAGRAVGDRPV